MKQTFLSALAGACACLGAVLLPRPALASTVDLDFCVEGGDCKVMRIVSDTSTFIEKTTVTQHSTDGKCAKRDGVIKRNLSRMDAKDGVVKIDPKCKYKIRFNTSSGCIGDKVAQMKPGQIDRFKGIVLKGACGNLKAKKYQRNDETGPSPNT